MYQCLKRIQDEGEGYAPNFDHSIGDPILDDIFVSQTHQIVIVEGNYLFSEGVWKSIENMCSEKWFVDVEQDIANERLCRRHMDQMS